MREKLMSKIGYSKSHPKWNEHMKKYNKEWRSKNKERYNKYQREYWKKRRLKGDRPHLKYYYGITPTDYERIFRMQNGQCVICGTKKSGKLGDNLYVDHNKKTKKVRGLLCYKCNFGLGCFNDSPIFLLKAVKYILESDYINYK